MYFCHNPKSCKGKVCTQLKTHLKLKQMLNLDFIVRVKKKKSVEKESKKSSLFFTSVCFPHFQQKMKKYNSRKVFSFDCMT